MNPTTVGGSNGDDGKGGDNDKSQATLNPYKMKPKDGESKVKTINNEECTWCDIPGNGQVEKNSTPLENTSQEVNFKVVGC